MGNLLFTDSMIDVLTRLDRHALVTPWFSAETGTVQDARHSAWMTQHTHTHQQLEISVTLSGGGLQGMAGNVYRRQPGIIFIFDAFTPHDYFFPRWAPPEEQLWISILDTHVVYSLLGTQQHGEARTFWRRDFDLDALGNFGFSGPPFREMAKQSAPAARLVALGVMGVLLSAIVQAGYQPEVEESTDLFQRRIIDTVRQHIRERAGNGVTLESLAHFAGYSKFHFHRLFKLYTGRTVHAYIDQCRIEKIREMQGEGRAQKEIADVLGFSSLSAYSHWARRLHGRHE